MPILIEQGRMAPSDKPSTRVLIRIMESVRGTVMMEINQSISKYKVPPQLLLVAKHARTAHCLGPAMRCLMQFSQGSGPSSPQSR